jgi:signal transduction histidine kinase
VSLRTRLMISFLVIAMIPSGLIGLMAVEVAVDSMEEAIGADLQGIAHARAQAIGEILHAHVEEARVLAAYPEVVEAVAAANARYVSQGEEQARAGIRLLDEQWRSADRRSPRADEVHDHPLAHHLRSYQERGPERYGEIFVTDRLGAAVAMTGRLSDYDQSDEMWWSVPFAQGTGGLFIDDRGVDSSVDALIAGVVVPVVDQGLVVGVVKINYRVQSILALVEPYAHDISDRVMLVRGDGVEVADSWPDGDGLAVAQPDVVLDRLQSGGWSRSRRGPASTLLAFARVVTPVYTRVPTEGAIKGVSGERWERLGWSLLVEADQDVVLAPIRALRRQILLLLALALVVVVLAARRLSSSISGPINQLSTGAEIVGAGDLDHRVGIERGDEIGVLSAAFDAMTRRLQTTLASRDLLDLEVGERKRVEEELRRTLDNLARSNRELEQFAYVASHDLKEPLRMVRSFTELLARQYVDLVDDKGRLWISYIVDGATRMQLLVDDLLAFSRIETQGRQSAPVHSGEVLDGVLRTLASRLDEAGGVVERGELPVVVADRIQLEQLFQNLVGNAIKYRSERPPRVEVRAARDGEVWRFTVRDNGLGIAPEHHERIFAIFQRLHGRSDYEGSGIGLAIARRIVERHGGTIGLDSEPGKGTTFWFTLPVEPE